MRLFLVLPCVVACVAAAACGTDDPSTSRPVSMRERLANQTHLYVAASDSAGAVTAQLKTSSGWDHGLVDLKLDGGELVAQAAADGTVALSTLDLGLQTITIPASVIGHQAELTRPHLRLAAPTVVTPAWSGDNTAEATATLDLVLTWALTVDGIGFPLGTPELPPLPVNLQLTGNGAGITAELRVHAAGDLWSWADLIKLSDLELVLGADTP